MPIANTVDSLSRMSLSSEFLFENNPDCIKILDIEGHLLSMNKNGQCLMELENLGMVAGAPWICVWPEESRAIIQRELEVARQGGLGQFTAFCPTAKGTPKWWDVRITPICGSDGELEGLLSISRDVTALHHAEENRMRAEAFANGQKMALELAVAGAPLNQVLSALTRTAEAHSEGKMLASVLLLDVDGKCLRVGAAESLPAEYNKAIDGIAIGPAVGSCGTAAYTKQSTFVRNIQLDPLWSGFHELAATHGLGSCWSEPIMSSQGKVLGTFAFYYREMRDPTLQERKAMPVLVHTAALVLEKHLEARERKAAEEALRKSESQLKRLIESNILGIVQYRYDGELHAANDAFLRAIGYTREEFASNGLSWRALTPPEWAEADKRGWQQLQADGVMKPFEKEFFRKDGSRTTVYVGAAKFEGSKDEGIAYILDISELKKAEQALKESEARFRTIANAMPQMVWSTLPDGYHDYYNDRWYEFTGVSQGSTDGEEWNGMFHPEDQQRAWKLWRHSLETGEPYEVEYRLRHHSGQYRWTLGRALPIRDDEGTIVRWLGTCTDIHEQKLTYEKLQQSDRRKDEFLAMLAHELRNPLAPISAAADLLSIVQLDEPRVRQISGVISRQARHMTGLIEDLLDVSRVTRGLVALDKASLDIKNVVAEAVEQVRPMVKERAHYLEIHMSSEYAIVSGDKKRLVQVLANLLSNAVRYTPNGGHIIVGMNARDGWVDLFVRDNGIGMSSELVERAFDLFAQGERTSDRSQGGLGIGLALVKSLVQLHGGTVKAHSKGPGQGSEFTISLPRLLQDDEQHHSGSSKLSNDMGNDALRVLIVDDNADAAHMLAMFLEAAGHQVHVEYHPIKAIDIARTVHPHVCLLDIGLPDIDGNELARRLRTMPGMEDAVFAAITGYGQPQDREAAFAAGFDYHFVKPVDTKKLAALLADVASHSH